MKYIILIFTTFLFLVTNSQSVVSYDSFEISRSYHERTTISYFYTKTVDNEGNWTISVEHENVKIPVKKLIIQNYTKEIKNHFNISDKLFQKSKYIANNILKNYKYGEFKILYTTDNKPIMPELGDRLTYIIIYSKKTDFKTYIIKIDNIKNIVHEPIIFYNKKDLKIYWDKTLNLSDGVTFF